MFKHYDLELKRTKDTQIYIINNITQYHEDQMIYLEKNKLKNNKNEEIIKKLQKEYQMSNKILELIHIQQRICSSSIQQNNKLDYFKLEMIIQKQNTVFIGDQQKIELFNKTKINGELKQVLNERIDCSQILIGKILNFKIETKKIFSNNIVLAEDISELHCAINCEKYYETANQILSYSSILFLQKVKQWQLASDNQTVLSIQILKKIFSYVFVPEAPFEIIDLSKEKYYTQVKLTQTWPNFEEPIDYRSTMKSGDTLCLGLETKITFIHPIIKFKDLVQIQNFQQDIAEFQQKIFKQFCNAQFIGFLDEHKYILEQMKQNKFNNLDDYLLNYTIDLLKELLLNLVIMVTVENNMYSESQPIIYILHYKNQKRYYLGRDIDNDIILNNSRVSRLHCSLFCRENRVIIYDGNDQGTPSSNGTWILLKKFQPFSLKTNNEDYIKIGSKVWFREIKFSPPGCFKQKKIQHKSKKSK